MAVAVNPVIVPESDILGRRDASGSGATMIERCRPTRSKTATEPKRSTKRASPQGPTDGHYAKVTYVQERAVEQGEKLDKHGEKLDSFGALLVNQARIEERLAAGNDRIRTIGDRMDLLENRVNDLAHGRGFIDIDIKKRTAV